MEIINMTPHALNIIDGNGAVALTIPSSGVARAAQKREHIADLTVDGASIPVSKSTYGAVEGLPAPVDGAIYVVSALTAQACPERSDVYITDDPVRDEAGRIIGCRGLARL